MISLMRAPHPIPYQGSKRFLAPSILRYFPRDIHRLFEPFAGAAAVSLAAALHHKARKFIIGDLNAPLMDLWAQIVNSPESISSAYRTLWQAQLGNEREYYDSVREKFNKTKRADYLLYLLLRCVKASVRYNSEGQFNQSPDNRRLGMRPDTLHCLLVMNSLLEKEGMAGKVQMVYMDPPYQGVCGDRDQRYFGGFNGAAFREALGCLNAGGISYILSYDGRSGERTYGQPMPSSLDLTRLEIDAGRSSQATLLGESSITVESIYLSPALVRRLGTISEDRLTARSNQLTLIDCLPEAYHRSTSSA